MLTGQDRVFWNGEGDAWFHRNQTVLADPLRQARDPVLNLMEFLAIRPRRVLEVGASNGWRLAAIRERYGSEATAVEPSQAAIDDGRIRFPGVTFVRGGAAAIPIDPATVYDLVVVNFVMHWIDRASLVRAAAEIDRTVAENGLLIIGDFNPLRPTRRRYHHLPDAEVWTYKQNYAELFLASGRFQLEAQLPFDHGTGAFSCVTSPDDRCCLWVLVRRDSSTGPPP